jgi:hypothetical protein
VTFDTETGDATITFDQRVFVDDATVAAGFVLLDQNGTPILSGAGTDVSLVPAAAGPMQVTVHFNPAAIGLARALEICGPPDDAFASANVPTECAGAEHGSVFTSDLSPNPDEPNVQQILSPFAISAKLVKRVTVWKPRATARKHTKHTKVRTHTSHEP